MKQTIVAVAGVLLMNNVGAMASDNFDARTERQAIGYQVENGSTDLRAGVPLRNRASGELTEATGRVTVLLEPGQLEKLAQEFDLTVVYQDASSGLGQLDASQHTDLNGLLQALRGHDMVRAARLEINERKHVLHQLQR